MIGKPKGWSLLVMRENWTTKFEETDTNKRGAVPSICCVVNQIDVSKYVIVILTGTHLSDFSLWSEVSLPASVKRWRVFVYRVYECVKYSSVDLIMGINRCTIWVWLGDITAETHFDGCGKKIPYDNMRNGRISRTVFFEHGQKTEWNTD